MNIADIFGSVRLNLETGEFEAQAAKAADKTSASMGQKMSAGLKKYAAAGIGAAFGAGLSMALSGAQELDAATRQLTADAGLTGDEAKAASKSLASMYRDNLQGFDEIGRAMASVRNDLGLVGKAADKATAKFLKYATATGQNAAESVASFDDILDAWNLTADDARTLMDGLITDHQRFGGTVRASQDALAAMAPAMQAANMSIDDGRALLNLFNASGIDAAKAPAALAKAVKELKPGQTLDDLIARIGAIEDPTMRAQEAMKVFGARSGIGLAQAIQPGMTSLDAFAVSATDAAGATDDAAKAIEDGFGNKAKMALKGFQGTLAELGTGFGDLIMVAALFGPKLTTAMLSGLGGLTGVLTKTLIPKVTAAVLATGPGAAIAASGVGTAIGTAMGAAIPIALVAAAGVGIALAFKSLVLDPGLQQQTRDIGTAVDEQIAGGTLDSLEQSRAALQQGIEDINNVPLGGFLYGDQIRDLQAQLDAVDAEILARASNTGEGIPQAMGEGVAAGTPGAVEAFDEFGNELADVGKSVGDKVVAEFGLSMQGVKRAAKVAGSEGMLALSAGITAARQAPLDAFTALKEMLKNALTPMGEIARLKGELASKELARGLKSGDPAVRAQAVAVAKLAADRLGELAAGGGKAGRAAMAQLDAGIRSKIPAVRDAAIAAKAAAVAKLEAAKGPAGAAGTAAGQAFATNLGAKAATGDFKISASVGFRLTRLAAGGPIVGPSWVGEKGPEIYVPQTPGRILNHKDSMAAVGGSPGAGITVNVYNPTPEPASTSTRRELRKLALSGSAV